MQKLQGEIGRLVESQLIIGDSLEVLKDYGDNSVDLLCTDPPYGYGFMGKSWDKTLPPKEIFEESLRVLKPGAFAFVMSAPRSDVQYRMTQMLDEVGFEVGYTPIYWTYATGFPKAMNVGKKTKKENLDGSYAGYQPKPAVEVVIVAMKPLSEKSYVNQALDNQKGITWLHDCRIPFAGMSDIEQYESDRKGFTERSSVKEGEVYSDAYGNEAQQWGFKKPKKTKRKPREENTVFKTSGFKSENNDTAEASPLGRFAANLLVSDDVLNVKSKGQLAPTTGKEPSNYKENNTHGSYLGYRKEMKPRDDGDSFSRYYDLDAWWNSRLSKLPEGVRKTFPFLVVPKASRGEKDGGLEYKNSHPTVKPLKLMSYLITLGSRKGDMVLDPFMGSGTTPISCVTLDRKYLGIEKEKEYFEIAEARVKKAINPVNLVEHDFF